MAPALTTTAAIVAAGHGLPLVLHQLTDPMQVSQVRAVVKDLACDDSSSTRFPGPNPVSLDTSHYPKLRGEPYYICEKTDGVRYLMVVCTLAQPAGPLKLVALLDRAMNAYVLPVQYVPKALFQGSLLDGELVWNKATKQWDFLVFDALTVSGIPIMNSTLPDRLRAVHKALGAYVHDDDDPVRLRVKSFFPCSDMPAAEHHLGKARDAYDTDGVILTPAKPGVVYGRHMGMFKLKFGSKHTVDFLVGQDGRQLSVFDAGRHVPVGTLRSPAPSGSVAECTLPDLATTVWDLVTIRTDKTTANDMYTYQKTLLNMREGLTLDHIKAVFVKM